MSDALSIAILLGTALGVVMYATAPWVLARIAGPASAAVVAPALVYVRIRCGSAIACQACDVDTGLCVITMICVISLLASQHDLRTDKLCSPECTPGVHHLTEPSHPSPHCMRQIHTVSEAFG